jgi:hypothetical protein
MQFSVSQWSGKRSVAQFAVKKSIVQKHLIRICLEKGPSYVGDIFVHINGEVELTRNTLHILLPNLKRVGYFGRVGGSRNTSPSQSMFTHAGLSLPGHACKHISRGVRLCAISAML